MKVVFSDDKLFKQGKEYNYQEILDRYPASEVVTMIIVKAKNGKELQRGIVKNVGNK